MIAGIGIDIIELNRIEQAVQNNHRFIKRILTINEQEAYNKYTRLNRQIEYLAGRFAVKEAFGKATGRGLGKLSFQDIEVLRGRNGSPQVQAKGYEEASIFVSISHSKEYVVAQIVIEKSR